MRKQALAENTVKKVGSLRGHNEDLIMPKQVAAVNCIFT